MKLFQNSGPVFYVFNPQSLLPHLASVMFTVYSWSLNNTSLNSGSSITYLKQNKAKQKTINIHFSRSVVSDSLQPHEPQHSRPPCPSPTLRVHLNPCPLSNTIQPSHLLSSPSPPPSIFLSIRVFSSGSVLCIRWPKYGSFKFILLSREA